MPGMASYFCAMIEHAESTLGFHEDRFAYWLENEKRYSPHTLQAYTSDLKFFVGFALEHECLTTVSEVRHSHVRAWIVDQMEREIVPALLDPLHDCDRPEDLTRWPWLTA